MQYEILLVDDEHSILDTIGPLLEAKGYGVTSVDNGKAAIEVVAKRNFDLVITDLVMDEPDGIEVLKNTKELSPETMVIILTGYGDMESAIDAFRFGADDYLTKPCNIQEIYFRVSRCLEKQDLKRQIVRQAEALQKSYGKLESKVEERTVELVNVNEQLNQEVDEHKRTEEALRKSEERFRHAFENANTGVCLVDEDGHFIKVNNRLCEILGYNNEELGGMTVSDIAHPEDVKLGPDFFRRSISGEMENTIYEKRYIHKRGHLVWGQVSSSIVRDSKGDPLYFVSHVQDISQQKHTQEALTKREKELERKNIRLGDLNAALKVLLEKRDEDRKELEEKMLINVKHLIMPYVAKLKQTSLNNRQGTFVDIIESNLDDIVSSFAQNLSFKYLDLTPKELQVANLVKQGMSTKEIASFFYSSPETISRHRKNIRKKLKLTDKKSNLRTHLLSFN